MPNLNASASQNFNFGSYIDQNGGRVSRDTRGNTFGVNSSLTIFNGFQNTNTYKQSKLGLESSKLQLSILKDNYRNSLLPHLASLYSLYALDNYPLKPSIKCELT